jgi:hypothetical protein
MNGPQDPGIRVLARAEANGPERPLFDKAILQRIRYADPQAWTAATAVARLLSGAHARDASAKAGTGVIAVSGYGPAEATAAVAEATRAGFPSALRYPAANPATVAGVPCVALGLRGPTLCLLNDPAVGVPPALLAARGWIERGAAVLVAVIACRRAADGGPRARAVLLGRGTPEGGGAADAEAWLLAEEES